MFTDIDDSYSDWDSKSLINEYLAEYEVVWNFQKQRLEAKNKTQSDVGDTGSSQQLRTMHPVCLASNADATKATMSWCLWRSGRFKNFRSGNLKDWLWFKELMPDSRLRGNDGDDAGMGAPTCKTH